MRQSRIAKQQKDIRAAALITMAYGRALLASGSADDYLAYIEEAQVLASEKSNPSIAAMLAAVQSHAVGQAGYLPRALSLNGAALERVEQIASADSATLGFDPKYWLRTLRARYLLLTNEAIAAEKQLDNLLRAPQKMRMWYIASWPWEFALTQRRSIGMLHGQGMRPMNWSKCPT